MRRIRVGGGADPLADFVSEILDEQHPSREGMPATSHQLRLVLAASDNRLTDGSFESFSAGTTSAPDSWTLTGTGATVARETTDVREGLRAVDLTNGANNAADLGQSLTISSTQNADLRSRTVTFTCDVLASAANRAFIRIDDGVGTTDSPYHTGGGAYETLAVRRTLDGSATKVECSIEIATGTAITITADNAMLAVGAWPLGFARRFLDQALAISNYQNTTPTNNVDQGVWRAEIGVTRFTGDTTRSDLSNTITLETAFRTVRIPFVTPQARVGGRDVFAYGSGITVSAFTVEVFTDNGALFANTGTGDVSWIAIGNV